MFGSSAERNEVERPPRIDTGGTPAVLSLCGIALTKNSPTGQSGRMIQYTVRENNIQSGKMILYVNVKG